MMNRIKNQVKHLLKAILLKQYGEKTIKIKDISLMVDFSDCGGRAYASPSSHEECASPIYDEIASYLGPKLVIDVGAKYGFTGLMFAKKFPNARVILVEPSPHLCSFIRRNFETNMINNYKVIHAICGKSESNKSLPRDFTDEWI